jgi:hypothetical protein
MEIKEENMVYRSSHSWGEFGKGIPGMGQWLKRCEERPSACETACCVGGDRDVSVPVFLASLVPPPPTIWILSVKSRIVSSSIYKEKRKLFILSFKISWGNVTNCENKFNSQETTEERG